MQHFLKHSAQAPLSIVSFPTEWVDPYPIPRMGRVKLSPDYVPSLTVVLKEQHRIRSLCTDGPTLAGALAVFKDGTLNAPILTTLEIKECSKAVLDTLQRALLPGLAHVDLDDCECIPWDGPLLRANLTSLSLRCRFVAVGQMKKLFDCLSLMPQLQSLVVDAKNFEEHPHHPSTSTTSLVELPSLQSLSLHLGLGLISLFMTRCRYPPSARVLLTTDSVEGGLNVDGSVNPLDSISSILVNSLVDPHEAKFKDAATITGLSIAIKEHTPWGSHEGFYYDVTIVVGQGESQREDRLRIPSNDFSPPPKFSFKYRIRGEDVTPLLLEIFQYPLPALAYLNIAVSDYESYLTIPDLASIATRLILQRSDFRLESLRLEGFGVDILTLLLTAEKGRPFDHVNTLVLNGKTALNAWSARDPVKTRLLDLCAAIRSHATSYDFSRGPFSTLVIETMAESRQRIVELVDSFSELFDQKGRFVPTEELPEANLVAPTRPSSPDLNTPVPRASNVKSVKLIEFVPLEPEPVELEPEVHPLAHLLLHPTTTSVQPTPRPAPPDYHWTDDARFGRVVVDFMGSTGLRSNFY